VKSLLLLRHGKAVRDDGLEDVERPLEDRGERASAAMGAWLRQQEWEPGRVLCSAATRTRQTLEALRPYLPPTAEVSVEDGLYLASTGELLTRVNALDDADQTVLVVGHNPAIEELAATLAGDGDANAARRMRAKFPTAGLAILTFPGAWREVAPGAGRLAAFVVPKDLV